MDPNSAGYMGANAVFHPIMLLPVAIMLFMLFQVLSAVLARTPPSRNGYTADGRSMIPLKASFVGIRGLPGRLAIAQNNASPLLILGDGVIDYRVMRRKQRDFVEIETVHFDHRSNDPSLQIRFKGRMFTLVANVQSLSDVRRALGALPETVHLTDAAKTFRTDDLNAETPSEQSVGSGTGT